MTLEDVELALSAHGKTSTLAHLSLVERGLVWPSREVVDSLVELFHGEITEIDILYPFGAPSEKKT
ncbi:hypothetical protein [Shewanella glacialipiscicola]|uniref:hypothetical protein n=1 Tax=Shewanella glacialipiscicola TaxID=614069 RepID=UPI003D79942C